MVVSGSGSGSVRGHGRGGGGGGGGGGTVKGESHYRAFVLPAVKGE